MDNPADMWTHSPDCSSTLCLSLEYLCSKLPTQCPCSLLGAQNVIPLARCLNSSIWQSASTDTLLARGHLLYSMGAHRHIGQHQARRHSSSCSRSRKDREGSGSIQLHEHTFMLASAFALPSCSSSAYAPSHFHCSAC